MEVMYPGFKLNGNQLIFTTQSISCNVNENFYRELKNVLKIRRPENTTMTRIGRIGDGGYVMAEPSTRGGV